MKIYTFTEKGKRNTNQDVFRIARMSNDQWLILVADGMGGYENGREAAQLAAESIEKYFHDHLFNGKTSFIQHAVDFCNKKIKEYSTAIGIKIGATIAGMVITPEKAMGFWVGDVHIYHISGSKIRFSSTDHTLLNE